MIERVPFNVQKFVAVLAEINDWVFDDKLVQVFCDVGVFVLWCIG